LITIQDNDTEYADNTTELVLFGAAMQAAADAFSDSARRPQRVCAWSQYCQLLTDIGAAMGVGVCHHYQPGSQLHYIDIEYQRQMDQKRIRPAV
jgi:hypothetical protein